MEDNYLSGYTFLREMANRDIGPTHLAKENQTGQSVIIKFFDSSLIGMNRVQHLMQRIDHLRALNSPFIVSATQCFLIDSIPCPNIISTIEPPEQTAEEEKKTFLVVIRPYIDSPPLPITVSQYIKNSTFSTDETSQQTTEDETKKLINQWKSIVRAVHTLHLHHIYPSFIKPNNIFILNDNQILITDIFPPPNHIDVMVHSPNIFDLGFLAPEFFECRQFPSQHSDTWSLGVLLLYMATGSLPWSHKNLFTMIHQILSQFVVPATTVSEEVDQYTSLMLVNKPEKRISLEGVLNETSPRCRHKKLGIRRTPTSRSVPFALNEMAGNDNDSSSKLPFLQQLSITPSNSTFTTGKKTLHFGGDSDHMLPRCIVRCRLKS